MYQWSYKKVPLFFICISITSCSHILFPPNGAFLSGCRRLKVSFGQEEAQSNESDEFRDASVFLAKSQLHVTTDHNSRPNVLKVEKSISPRELVVDAACNLIEQFTITSSRFSTGLYFNEKSALIMTRIHLKQTDLNRESLDEGTLNIEDMCELIIPLEIERNFNDYASSWTESATWRVKLESDTEALEITAECKLDSTYPSLIH